MSKSSESYTHIAGMREYADALNTGASFEDLAYDSFNPNEVSEQLSLAGLNRIWGYTALPQGINATIAHAIKREAPHRHWQALQSGLLVPGPMILACEDKLAVYPGIALFQ